MISPNVNIYTIIVTYNGMRWVDACFGSLRGSTVPLHTVVVDNGSTDGTPQRIAERFPEVHLIRSDENLGFGRGNNAGIRYALGQGATHFSCSTRMPGSTPIPSNACSGPKTTVRAS